MRKDSREGARRISQGQLHVAPREGIGFAHIPGLAGHSILDRHGGRFGGDLDPRKQAGAAGSLARLGDHGEDRLPVIGNLTVCQDRVAADRRTAVVHAGDIICRQDRDDARCRPDCLEIRGHDAATGGVAGVTRIDMHQTIRLPDVVDIGRAALHMKNRAIMTDGLADALRDQGLAGDGHQAGSGKGLRMRVVPPSAPAISISALPSNPCATFMR